MMAAAYIFDSWPLRSILDVGCGENKFAKALRLWPRRWLVLGADVVPRADVRADAAALPFFDDEFDLVTSFDALDKLPPEQVDAALRECVRVSKAFVFSVPKTAGRPLEWWMVRASRAGGVEIQRSGQFIYGRWKGKEDVTKKPFLVKEGESVVLVGNGPSVTRSEFGAKIDAFNHVIRFNAFKVKGFERFSGRKTTAWATFGRGIVPQDNVKPLRAIIRGTAEPAYPLREVWRIPSSLYKEKREEIKAVSGRDEEGKNHIIPSSGFLLLSWLLANGVPKVHLIGFDHFSKETTGQHHYWLKQAYRKPKEHDGDAEATLVAMLLAAGKVEYLA